MSWSRDDSLENIICVMEQYKWMKQMEKKYKGSNIGFTFGETVEMLKEELQEMTREHKKDFKEYVSVRFIEELV